MHFDRAAAIRKSQLQCQSEMVVGRRTTSTPATRITNIIVIDDHKGWEKINEHIRYNDSCK